MRTVKPDSLDSMPTVASPEVFDLFSCALGYQAVDGIDNFQQAIEPFKASIPNLVARKI